VHAIGTIAALGALLGSAAGSARAAPAGANEIRQADRHCQTGLKALQTGNVAKAREAFARAFEAAPNFPPAHLGLGHVALAERDFSRALAEYTAARDTWSTFGDLLEELEMARWSRTQDEIRRLQDELRQMQNRERGLVSGESLSTTQRTLQTSLEQRIRTLEAVPMPTTDVTTDPPADIEFHLGNALFRLERYEEARSAWETCAQKNPEFPLVRNNLAVLYLKAGRIEEARRAVAEAEALGMKVNPGLKEDIEHAAAQKR